jgi:hypothetical protein
MLRIKGYQKLLQTEFLGGRYHIQQVSEYDRFYDIQIINERGNTSLFGLRRESFKDYEGSPIYDILLNGKDIKVSVTANWISDKDNMVTQLEGILRDYPF